MATFTLHSDKLIECPFDKNHKIAVRNKIKHIIECEKKVVSKFSVCIYNASHRMARHEFATHIKSCPDGRQQIRELYTKQLNSDETKPDVIREEALKTQVISVTENNVKDLDECDSDNWDNDNNPHYSIYDTKTPNNSNINDVTQNKSQKMTKNQKKRNRRKAAIASQQTNSV